VFLAGACFATQAGRGCSKKEVSSPISGFQFLGGGLAKSVLEKLVAQPRP